MRFPQVIFASLAFWALGHVTICRAEGYSANISINQELSPEIVSFIARNSVVTASPRTTGRLEDLVRESCGYVSPNNLKVFERTVVEYGGVVLENGTFRTEAETTLVPACLPDEQELRVVGRLPAPGDTLTDYARADLELPERQIASDWLGSESVSVPASGINDAFPISKFDGSIFERKPLPSPPSMVPDYGDKQFVEQIFKDRFNVSKVNPQDRSRVAYEGFAVTKELIDAGASPVSTRSALEEALQAIGAKDAPQIITDIDRAVVANQEVPRFDEASLWDPICALNPATCNAEASGSLLHLESADTKIIRALNSSARVAPNLEIYAQVPVLTVERANRQAIVPLKTANPAPTGVTVSRTNVSPPPALTLFLHVFDQVEESQLNSCGEGPLTNWGTEAFQTEFREVALEALSRKIELNGRANNTELMVLDGGFARFTAEHFGEADWTTLPNRTHHASAESMNGIPPSLFEKLSHGTAVTSLAMGGLGLMDLFRFDQLPVVVSSRPIYRERVRAGTREYVPIDSIPDLARDYGAHIVNMSFGTRDDDEARIGDLHDRLLNEAAALFIVAAGNLGNNDMEGGQSVRQSALKPQVWGDPAQGGGRNMIVVAATDVPADPRKLAWFSNFGKDAVLLAAPGCRVPVIVPTLEGKYVNTEFNGTSFSAPIVSFVAAAVRSVLPRGRISSIWIRARLLATADIEPEIAGAYVGHGRVLNPIAAMRVYDDIVSMKPQAPGTEPVEVIGRITHLSASDVIDTSSLCEIGYAEGHSLLRFFFSTETGANGDRVGQVDIMVEDGLMQTNDCRLKSFGNLKIETSNGPRTIRFDQIADIKFAFNRGIE